MEASEDRDQARLALHCTQPLALGTAESTGAQRVLPR